MKKEKLINKIFLPFLLVKKLIFILELLAQIILRLLLLSLLSTNFTIQMITRNLLFINKIPHHIQMLTYTLCGDSKSSISILSSNLEKIPFISLFSNQIQLQDNNKLIIKLTSKVAQLFYVHHAPIIKPMPIIVIAKTVYQALEKHVQLHKNKSLKVFKSHLMPMK